MFESNGLMGSSSVTKNENAGFVTPRNKIHPVSRKALFTDKPKMALGDLKKSSLNVLTPMKNATIEKVKTEEAQLQPSTSAFKPPPKVDETLVSTPKPQPNVIDYSMDDVDVWSQKLILSLGEDQFDFIFMDPPEVAPPPWVSPPSSPEYDPEWDHVPRPVDSDDESIGEFVHKATNTHEEFDLPAICQSPTVMRLDFEEL